MLQKGFLTVVDSENQSPPARKPGLPSAKLEEQRAILAGNEEFVKEINKQIETHERGIVYIDNIIKKILESTTYLQRLLVSREFSVIDLACLINLYPDIITRIVAGGLYEKRQGNYRSLS